jgi:hypothetical protein
VLAKRAGLALASLLLGLVLLEVGTRTIHRIRQGEPFPADALRERLKPTEDLDRLIPAEQPVADGQRGLTLSDKVIHPYLGFVQDRGVPAGDGLAVNRFGFPGIDPLRAPAPDEVRVLITGGSVALQLFREGGRPLRRYLSAAPAFAGKRVQLVVLALGGYKQPQQLIALSWLLALGAHFDVVINLDGFNEIVLPKSDNAPVGVHPSFPRSWDFYQGKGLDLELVAHAAETRRLLETQRDWRAALGTGLPSYSAFALSVLLRVDDGIGSAIAARDAAFRERRNSAGLGFQATGPFVPYPSDAALFSELVELWQASSRQMHQLASASGARYFHFLQPNQWVPDAKPWSAIEADQLRVPDSFTPRTAVPAGYPLLDRAGGELREQGVSFHSLVLLFLAERRTVYRDTCCHFNRLGIRTIAREIARVVSEELSPEPGRPGA